MKKTITIYLFRDAVMIVEWTYGKFAKVLNTVWFPENMKEDVKYLINKYLQKNLKQVCNKMMLDDGAEAISIKAWSGFT